MSRIPHHSHLIRTVFCHYQALYVHRGWLLPRTLRVSKSSHLCPCQQRQSLSCTQRGGKNSQQLPGYLAFVEVFSIVFLLHPGPLHRLVLPCYCSWCHCAGWFSLCLLSRSFWGKYLNTPSTFVASWTLSAHVYCRSLKCGWAFHRQPNTIYTCSVSGNLSP